MEPDVEAAAISGNWTRRAAAGAFCKQDPTGSPEQMPRQCAVWEQPAWGRMKKLPVGNSPQVANGCIEYTCRSVRAEHVIFLDQRLELMLKRLLLACEHGASMIGSWANETWIRMKLNWARMFGLQHTYEQAANEHLAWMQEEAFRKSVMVKMKGDTSSFGEYTHVDPMTITPGTRMESAVSGCMYPFMNCKNQLLQAKRLCHDDGYWVRHVRDFHCTGGFIASEPGEAEKWKYIDHFAISMALLVGAVVIGLVVRAYMLNRLAKHAGVDHRLWWLRGQTEQSTPPDREIVQITV
ncbi:hypothetical protein GUITHDRAFT_152021 [Guillardia theta CCMP2712]|uniref:Uncharacterized protein n=1 Tax=Guillardia theta (strain CCMP2712) TaxID=905079 RepID=L1JGB6_GUITC|nr:hypothetical protein GUITHDRAFT_152021 [Guillardia theta CCMP2712]EKX47541.1 hypothetical protein GUITHDRAFT_152021 [Guillardia theta CCMP2712]|eukprot:XP_005834521.1 hypothetical protein GUITHDRAFT_152021 [Guillardia theta CCMP2712]